MGTKYKINSNKYKLQRLLPAFKTGYFNYVVYFYIFTATSNLFIPIFNIFRHIFMYIYTYFHVYFYLFLHISTYLVLFSTCRALQLLLPASTNSNKYKAKCSKYSAKSNNYSAKSNKYRAKSNKYSTKCNKNSAITSITTCLGYYLPRPATKVCYFTDTSKVRCFIKSTSNTSSEV